MCVRLKNHWYCFADRGRGLGLHHSCKSRRAKKHQQTREWVEEGKLAMEGGK